MLIGFQEVQTFVREPNEIKALWAACDFPRRRIADQRFWKGVWSVATRQSNKMQDAN